MTEKDQLQIAEYISKHQDLHPYEKVREIAKILLNITNSNDLSVEEFFGSLVFIFTYRKDIFLKCDSGSGCIMVLEVAK